MAGSDPSIVKTTWTRTVDGSGRERRGVFGHRERDARGISTDRPRDRLGRLGGRYGSKRTRNPRDHSVNPRDGDQSGRIAVRDREVRHVHSSVGNRPVDRQAVEYDAVARHRQNVRACHGQGVRGQVGREGDGPGDGQHAEPLARPKGDRAAAAGERLPLSRFDVRGRTGVAGSKSTVEP